MRADTPALDTMPRWFPSGFSKAKCGVAPLDQASPASKNGEMVVGRYGKLIRPYSGTPNSGMRNSALNTPIRLPKRDRKSTRLNSSHVEISYAVFCLKKKKKIRKRWSAHSAAKSTM